MAISLHGTPNLGPKITFPFHGNHGCFYFSTVWLHFNSFVDGEMSKKVNVQKKFKVSKKNYNLIGIAFSVVSYLWRFGKVLRLNFRMRR